MRLDLVVGPNGAGKSTFVAREVVPDRPTVPFVNADLIAAERWPDDPATHAREAGALAGEARERLLVLGLPFIAETVFSHPSKLDLIATAKARHFHVALHVLMVPEDLAVARVALRVAQGGHWVPTDRIRARYRRLWPLVGQAVGLVDVATFYGNAQEAGARVVATFLDGVCTSGPQWPEWAPEALVVAW